MEDIRKIAGKHWYPADLNRKGDTFVHPCPMVQIAGYMYISHVYCIRLKKKERDEDKKYVKTKFM